MIDDPSVRGDGEAASTLGAPQAINHVECPIRCALYGARAGVIREQMSLQADAEGGEVRLRVLVEFAVQAEVRLKDGAAGALPEGRDGGLDRAAEVSLHAALPLPDFEVGDDEARMAPEAAGEECLEDVGVIEVLVEGERVVDQSPRGRDEPLLHPLLVHVARPFFRSW